MVCPETSEKKRKKKHTRELINKKVAIFQKERKRTVKKKFLKAMQKIRNWEGDIKTLETQERKQTARSVSRMIQFFINFS